MQSEAASRSGDATRKPRADGLFGPGSAAWRVHRERVLLLAGPRALLMQLAHPLVAAGVADHSDFRSDPIGRLRRTLEVTLGMVFGEPSRARSLAASLRRVHERVEGTLRDETARFPRGTPYRALDPDLLLWVHATLVDSALEGYRRWVGPLPPDERARYYQDSRLLATHFGIPEARVPPDFGAFRRYLRDMLSGPELEVTPTARELAQAVLRPSRPLWLSALGGVSTALAAGLLPARLRRGYGLRFGAAERRALALAESMLRRSLPWLPAPLRYWPEAREALRRSASRG